MKIRSIFFVVLLMAIAFLVGWTTAPPQKWQYQQTCSLDQLNTLGFTGWELVSVTQTDGNTSPCFYLKRPVN